MPLWHQEEGSLYPPLTTKPCGLFSAPACRQAGFRSGFWNRCPLVFLRVFNVTMSDIVTLFGKNVQTRFTKPSSGSILLIWRRRGITGDIGKKPLYILVIDLMKQKAFMSGVSKCVETELLELGTLLQASEWCSHEGIIAAALLAGDLGSPSLRKGCAFVSPAIGRYTIY